MDQMSFVSVIFVSIPEEFLLILMTALIIGRRDILNFRNKENIIRVAVATVLTALCCYFLRYYSEDMLFNTVVQMVFFISAYIFILKIKWYKASIGFLISIIVNAVFEQITVALMAGITGITLSTAYSNDLQRILLFLPTRALQIIYITIFYRLSATIIRFEGINLIKKKFIKKIAIIHVYLVIAFIQIVMTMKYIGIDLGIENIFNEPFFWLNIIFTITLTIMLIVTTRRLNRTIELEKQDKIISLIWFKKLLNEYGHNIEGMKNEIDDVINKYRRGLM